MTCKLFYIIYEKERILLEILGKYKITCGVKNVPIHGSRSSQQRGVKVQNVCTTWNTANGNVKYEPYKFRPLPNDNITNTSS